MSKVIAYPNIDTEHGEVEVRGYRRTKYTGVQVDFIFWPKQVRDAAGQDPLVDRLGAIASDRCYAQGRTGDIIRTSGPTLWSMTVPNADADTVVDALTARVEGNPGPLLQLILDWSAELKDSVAA